MYQYVGSLVQVELNAILKDTLPIKRVSWEYVDPYEVWIESTNLDCIENIHFFFYVWKVIFNFKKL